MSVVKKIVVLLSGRGSNLEAIVRSDIPNAQVVAVFSNRPDAQGLVFAKENGIYAYSLDHKQYESRELFDQALLTKIEAFSPDLVVLAGFMRVLTPQFVDHYEGRMLNIHPSLLPAFSGLHTHQRAIDSGAKVHGASVHFVTSALDVGPIVIQGVVPILDEDTEASLAQRVLEQEHKIYPQAIRWFVEGRLSIDQNRVRLSGQEHVPTSWSAPCLL